MAYIKPQVLVYQEFTSAPNTNEEDLRAWIVGPNAILHRYAEPTEKSGIKLGNVETDNILNVDLPYPGKSSAGSLVDKSYVKVFADNALLEYAKVESSADSYAYNALDGANVITFTEVGADGLNLATNGTYARDAIFGSRDVQVGDKVRISVYAANGTVGAAKCSDKVYESTITALLPQMQESAVSGLANTENANLYGSATTASVVAGTAKCGEADAPVIKKNDEATSELAVAEDTTFAPYKVGALTKTYTLEVTKYTNTAACQSIEITVSTASGIGDTIQVPLNTTSSSQEFDIDEGVSVTLTTTIGDVKKGDKYTVTLAGEYKPAKIEVDASDYSGDNDVTYYVDCLKGGTIGGADAPKVCVRSSDGEEYFVDELSSDTEDEVTFSQIVMPRGVSIKFTSLTNDSVMNNELAVGAQYKFRVSSKKNGPIQGIRLKDALPYSFRTFAAGSERKLDVSFCVAKTVELAASNYTADENSIKLNEVLSVSDPEFKSLTLLNSDLYVQYREFVSTGAGILNYVGTADDLNAIPGQLDPDNPLKYGVYKAYANSNGVEVVYTPVVSSDPENDLDAWSDAFAAGAESKAVYTIVPMTQKIAIQNLAFATANKDSDEESCAWKHCVFNTTVADENVILTTDIVVLADNAGKYTRCLIDSTSGASTKNVSVGDVVRVWFQGAEQEYVIDEITSTTELSLLSGPSAQIGTGTEAEDNLEYVGATITHVLTKQEKINEIKRIADSFSSRRVELVWPDKVGEGGVWLPGYYLCAAIAGLMSGVQPHQGLTRVEIAGFDDYSYSSPYFTDSQLKQLAGSGVWICLTDRDGTSYTYHAVTTDMTDLNTQEEMITRNMDSLSKYFSELLAAYIGQTVINDDLIETIRRVVGFRCYDLLTYSASSIGPRINDYVINTVEQDPLLRDRVNVQLTVELPMATNNIALYIYA